MEKLSLVVKPQKRELHSLGAATQKALSLVLTNVCLMGNTEGPLS